MRHYIPFHDSVFQWNQIVNPITNSHSQCSSNTDAELIAYHPAGSGAPRTAATSIATRAGRPPSR